MKSLFTSKNCSKTFENSTGYIEGFFIADDGMISAKVTIKYHIQDTSDLDYFNGTGYSHDLTILDEEVEAFNENDAYLLDDETKEYLINETIEAIQEY